MVPHRAGRAARPPPVDRVRDNGRRDRVLAPSRSASAPVADDVLAAAVEQARAAAVETAGDPALVGDHLGRRAGAGRARRPTRSRPRSSARCSPTPSPAGCPATSAGTGRSPSPGFPARTRSPSTRSSCSRATQALLAPAWVPWHERLRPGDLSVGDVLPSTEDDPRLAPAYLVDDDSADDPEGSVVA